MVEGFGEHQDRGEASDGEVVVDQQVIDKEHGNGGGGRKPLPPNTPTAL